MPRKSSAVPVAQKSTRYSVRVAMKETYLSESSDSEESKRSSSSSDSEVAKPPVVLSSESDEEAPNEFLKRRERNIKANKAMLAKLVAELDKLPGNLQSASTSQDGETQKYKRRSRESLPKVEPRMNPERAARRVTRSMGAMLLNSPQKEEPQQSLEDKLLEERDPIRRRGFTPASIHVLPHVVRPVEDITEEELNNVAANVKGKVYNATKGSTCHQCRQKTIDTKTNCRDKKCHGIQGQFCGPCLRNRYGEDVRKALLDPHWTCPPCRGICNCSLCRQRDGYCATGRLVHLARYRGYSDVHSYLTSLHKKIGE